MAITRDGRTMALLANTEIGAKVFVLHEGKVLASLPADGDELLLSPDGERVVLLEDTILKCYSLTGEPLWIVNSPQSLYQARYSTDGTRIAVSDDLGMLHVYDKDGQETFSCDLGAYTITAWLPNGDLLAASWMGTVYRLSADGTQRWHTLLNAPTMPEATVPTISITPVAVTHATAAAGANLLTPARTVLLAQFVNNRTMQATGSSPRPLTLANPNNTLIDGLNTPPANPWLNETDFSRIESGWVGEVVLIIENVQQLLRVDEVEFIEDPAHPESWIRDARLEYFDIAADIWKFAGYLCADSADHVHKLATPVVASRFRIVKSDGRAWPTGNLRLAEIIFRGQALGTPHPDAVAGKPLLTLFDDGDSIFNECYFTSMNSNLALQASTAEEPSFAGSFFMKIKSPGLFGAKYPFVAGGGAIVPSWGIPIVERPAAGQYRFLRLAWRALSETTTGITVGVTDRAPRSGGFLVAGKSVDGIDATRTKIIANTAPTDWQLVTVDLWELAGKKPFQVSNLLIGSQGGPAAIDNIQLAATEADFAP